MDNIPASAFVAAGAIAAALITGFFSFLNLITSKEQKVSEFRQHWINELRQEISNYTASITYLSIAYGTYRKKRSEDKDLLEFYDSVRESHEKITSAFTSILLRINPNEKNKALATINLEFLEALHKTRELFNENKLEESRLQCNLIREKSIPLLKEEWKRVKRGERAYIVSKIVAVILLLSGLISGGVFFYYFPTQTPSATPTKQKAVLIPTNTISTNPAMQEISRDKAAKSPRS